MEEIENTTLALEGDDMHVMRSFDIEPVLDEIRDLKAQSDGKSATGEMYHVGRLPKGIIELYCNQVGITFHEFLNDRTHIKRILNDADYKHFRVWEGNL